MTTCFIGNVGEKNLVNCGNSPNSPKFSPRQSFVLYGMMNPTFTILQHNVHIDTYLNRTAIEENNISVSTKCNKENYGFHSYGFQMLSIEIIFSLLIIYNSCSYIIYAKQNSLAVKSVRPIRSSIVAIRSYKRPKSLISGKAKKIL